MVGKTNYQEYTDKYFLRSKEILKAENINPIVRYQVFARQDIDSLSGIDESNEFIRNVSGDKVKIYSLKEGDSYTAKEPIKKLEGRAQDIIDLETVDLEILSGSLTGSINMDEVREKAKVVVEAAQGKPVYYFGARHFHYSLDEEISKICQEEGFAGCSTDIGAKVWGSKGIGTIPHSLILSYAAHMDQCEIKGNPTIEAAKAFDRVIDSEVPRVVLIDTFNREITDSLKIAKVIPNLSGVRIDTCGENYSEESNNLHLDDLNLNSKYLDGKGVSISAVWALRRGLDLSGFRDLEITVSSGFNAEKTKAFLEADNYYQKTYGKPLFDSIGTGSLAKPVMTTSDIVSYYNEKNGLWIPMSKKGRGECFTTRLEEIK
jgi:nicotinate phosphoribosyltransferase